MPQDQFGIGVTLHAVIHLLADLALLGMVACIALVVVSVVAVARGRAESWTKDAGS